MVKKMYIIMNKPPLIAKRTRKLEIDNFEIITLEKIKSMNAPEK